MLSSLECFEIPILTILVAHVGRAIGLDGIDSPLNKQNTFLLYIRASTRDSFKGFRYELTTL